MHCGNLNQLHTHQYCTDSPHQSMGYWINGYQYHVENFNRNDNITNTQVRHRLCTAFFGLSKERPILGDLYLVITQKLMKSADFERPIARNGNA